MTSIASKPLCPVTRICGWLRSVLYYEHWMIGIVDQPIENSLRWMEMPPVTWVEPFSSKRYLADPFPWPGKPDVILAETYDVAKRLGRISTFTLQGTRITSESDAKFPLQGHLSFPLVFEEGGEIYALPESCATGRLEILRWDALQGWGSFVTIFSHVPAADAVLHKKDGLYWIFYTDVSHHPHDNLHLTYAPSLMGPWQQHPGNPVQHGADRSRNGGKIFEAAGRLYRPAQDCSRVYGGALRIMEITEWTKTSYAEKEVTYIKPSDVFYRDGFHTLVAWNDRQTLVDGMRLVFSWRLLFDKVLKRLGLA
jgi:hypothetical protein